MNQPDVNPYQPAELVDTSDQETSQRKKRSAGVNIVCMNLWAIGGFVMLAGLVPLAWLVQWLLGWRLGRDPGVLAAAVFLYCGGGTAIICMGLFLHLDRTVSAILSLCFAVLIPVIFFGVLGF